MNSMLIGILLISLFLTVFTFDSNLFRNKLLDLANSGQYKEILKELNEIEIQFGTLIIDNISPSFYLYKGIAYHGLQRIFEATDAFEKAVYYYPDDTRSWINLGTKKLSIYEIISISKKFTINE